MTGVLVGAFYLAVVILIVRFVALATHHADQRPTGPRVGFDEHADQALRVVDDSPARWTPLDEIQARRVMRPGK